MLHDPTFVNRILLGKGLGVLALRDLAEVLPEKSATEMTADIVKGAALRTMRDIINFKFNGFSSSSIKPVLGGGSQGGG
jgi:hypothetical protein